MAGHIPPVVIRLIRIRAAALWNSIAHFLPEFDFFILRQPTEFGDLGAGRIDFPVITNSGDEQVKLIVPMGVRRPTEVAVELCAKFHPRSLNPQ